MAKNNVTSDVTTKKATFSKEQIVHAERYKHRQDAANAVLEDGQSYTLDEVDGLIEKLMKGKGE